jgi:hypothetical protein
MKRVNVPVDKMGKFAGKWVAIDYKKNRIIAVGDTLEEIGPLVTSTLPKEPVAHSFKVPRKDEGPYVL